MLGDIGKTSWNTAFAKSIFQERLHLSSGHILCAAHGWQLTVRTSPRLAHAIGTREVIPDSEIMEYEVKCPDWGENRSSVSLVDCAFLQKFVEVLNNKRLVLLNREMKLERLNDRLLIQRIGREMKTVCPRCLEAVIKRSTPMPS